MTKLKSVVRKRLPARWQVPIKYRYCQFRGTIEKEIRILPLFLEKGDLAIDVGGNLGAYSFALKKLGCQVVVFEPNPDCATVLQAWGKYLSDVTVWPLALSSEPGSAVLRVPVDQDGIEHSSSASIEDAKVEENVRCHDVKLEPLDAFGLFGAKFIKIDVEGHELSVLAGAEQTIAESRAALLVEIEQRHNLRSIDDVFATILARGYQGFFLAGALLRPLGDFDLELHQTIDAFQAGDKVYVNNFLFLHESRIEGGDYDKLFSEYPAS